MIEGGIYIGVFQQEAVVIDRKYKELEPVVQETLVSCRSENNEKDILKAVLSIINEFLPRDEEALTKLQFHTSMQEDQKIILDAYVRNKVGAWRHQVLLGAYLLERLREAKILKGFPSFDPRFDNSIGDREKLLYVSETGTLITIFDPPDIGFG
jgi:hypothetical protein